MDAAARATKRVQPYHGRRSVRRADDASAHPQDSHDVRRAARLHVRNLNRDDGGTRVRHRHAGRHSLQHHSRKPLTRAHRRDRRGCYEGDHREGNPYGRRAEGACAASLYMVVVVIGMRPVFHGTRLSKPTRWVNSTRIRQPVAFERFYEDRLAVYGHLQEDWLRPLCSDAPNRPHSKG